MNYNPQSIRENRKCQDCLKEVSMWPGQKRCLDCSISVNKLRNKSYRVRRLARA